MRARAVGKKVSNHITIMIMTDPVDIRSNMHVGIIRGYGYKKPRERIQDLYHL